ncbi:TetR/AcrR family transcriptional regulator [Nocardia concava]|uniref:TetR/AcrR family transcriptional regulator n=1 Tax=Nocardia concava TaxID=257281 RepID=UPI000300A3A8|nr:TetR/AcrR family transcriptional regulator [Nocardia concava]
MVSTSPRERYREQMRAEIKQHAWEQIAASGASALSLNAIAKQVGLSGPALYRYFASRDELITELIREAYRSLADTVKVARADGADIAGIAQVIREWALADPQRYFLIYGTPVPGYHAPADTTAISDEIMTVLLEALDSNTGRALSFWTRVHGVLSLELAGHFNGMAFDPAVLFADEVDQLSR